MSEYYTFLECFGVFNWILMFHGLSGFIFNEWNRYRLTLIGVVICSTFWIIGSIQFVEFFIFNLNRSDDNRFDRINNLIDEFRWNFTALNTHCVNIFLSGKVQVVLKPLLTSSGANICKRTKILFHLTLYCSLFYFYVVVLGLRWNYQTNNGNTLAILPFYCFLTCTMFLDQLFLFILVWQVELNLRSLNFFNIPASVRLFDLNLDVYEDILALFSRMILLYLLNLLIGTTFYIFVGCFQQQWQMGFYEHFIWEWTWLVLILCIYGIHRVSWQVNLRHN